MSQKVFKPKYDSRLTKVLIVSIVAILFFLLNPFHVTPFYDLPIMGSMLLLFFIYGFVNLPTRIVFEKQIHIHRLVLPTKTYDYNDGVKIDHFFNQVIIGDTKIGYGSYKNRHVLLQIIENSVDVQNYFEEIPIESSQKKSKLTNKTTKFATIAATITLSIIVVFVGKTDHFPGVTVLLSLLGLYYALFNYHFKHVEPQPGASVKPEN